MFIQRNYMVCESLNRVNLRMISFGRAIVEEKLRRPVGSCPFSRVYFMLRGSFWVKGKDGESYELKEGGAYLVPSGAKFEYVCEEEAEYLFFHIKWSGIDELDLMRRCRYTVCRLDDVDWQPAVLHIIQHESRSLADGIWLKNEMDRLLLRCADRYEIDLSEPKYSDCTLRALFYIQKNLSATFNLNDIATASLVAGSTITRFFRNEVGCSMTEYVYELLWTESCRLLSNTQLNLQKICEELGFCEPSFFSRQFYDRLKVRPGEFRKQALI